MIRKRDPIIKGLQVLLMLIVVSACSLAVDDIEVQDLVGVWVEDRENCENELSGCAWFEFAEDGHFTAENLPYDYFGYLPFSSSKAIFDASGTWEIELSSDPLGNHKVRIRFEQSRFDSNPEVNRPVYNTSLYVGGKKGDFYLFEWHGDPSDSIYFRKLTENN